MAQTDVPSLGTWGQGAPAAPAAPDLGTFKPTLGGGNSDTAPSLGSWGQAPGATATVPLNAPAGAKAPSSGGKGLFGQIGDLVSAVRAVPKGIGTFAANVVEAPIAVGEKAINTGLQAAGDKSFLLGNENPALNAFARSPSWTNATQAKAALGALPAVGGIASGLATLGTHAQGNAELLANAPSALLRAVGAPAPNVAPSGAENKLIQAYAHHPVNSAISDAGSLLLLADAGGKVLPGGTGETLEGLANAPTEALKGVGSKLTDLAPQGLQDAIARQRAGVGLRGAQMEAGVDPIAIARDNARALGDVGANPTEQAAGTLRARGMDTVLRPLIDNPSPVNDIVIKNLLDKAGVPEDIQQAAVKEALTPTGNTSAYESALRGIRESADERYQAGYGDAPGKAGVNRAEQNVPEYRQSVVDRMVGEGKTVEEAQGSIEAIPSRFRAPVLSARSILSDFGEQYKDLVAAGARGGALDDVEQVMREIEPLTTPEFWQGKEAPVFLPGTGTPEGFDAEGKPVPTAKGRYVTTNASKLQTGISTAFDQKGQLSLELNSLKQAASNRALTTILDRVGTSADQAFGAQSAAMSGPDIAATMRENGYEAIDPHATTRGTIGVADKNVDEHTVFVPKEYADAMARQFEKVKPEGRVGYFAQQGGKGLDVATQHAYRDFLSASPHFALLRTVGDAFITAIKGDIAPSDFIAKARQAAQLIDAGEEPAALSRGIGNVGGLSNPGLNDTTLSDRSGVGATISRVTQAVPRTLDLMSRTMVFLQKAEDLGVDISDPSTPEYAQAVREANQAFGSLNSLTPGERNIVARIVPAYPWMKSVVTSLLGSNGFLVENPAAAALVLNLGRLAASDPSGFGQSSIAAEANPLSIFSLGGGGVNPIIRAGVGAGAGLNLSTGKTVTREGSGQLGLLTGLGSGGQGLTPAQAGYFAANQILPTKALLNSPASALLAPLVGGRTGTPLDQNLARYQSGQLKTSKGPPEPAYLPAVHTPVGTFGSYIPQLLGTPESPKQTPKATAAHAKAVKTASKTASDYAKNIARLRAKGIQ